MTHFRYRFRADHSRQTSSVWPWRVGFLAALILAVGDGRAEEADDLETADSIVAQSALLRVLEQVSTPARAAGILASIQVKEGDIVEEGHLLAKVDDTEAELIYHRAKIEYELARQRAADHVAIRAAEKALEFSREEFLRLKRATEKIPGSISKSELDEGQLTAERAALDLQKAQHDLRLAGLTERLKQTEQVIASRAQEIHQIVAPLNGMVVDVLRRRGEWVEPGDEVLRIMRIDRLRAEGLVAVQDVMLDLTGAPVEIIVTMPERPDVKVNGRVVFVSPEINPVNGQVRVRAEFDNPGGRLMPGMRATMVIHPGRVDKDGPAVAETGLADPDIP